MSRPYTLLMQKSASDSPVRDLYETFGFVCTDVPVTMFADIKELDSNDWKDEHGEDAYIPDTLMIKAYDWDIAVCYKGDAGTGPAALRTLLDYLTGLDGSGVEMKLYSPYTGVGRSGCYYKGSSGHSLHRIINEDIVEVTLRFRVTSPVANIVLGNG